MPDTWKTRGFETGRRRAEQRQRRLYRIVGVDGRWKARLKDLTGSVIALAWQKKRGSQEGAWAIEWVTLGGARKSYSVEMSQRAAVFQLGEAAEYALSHGWLARLAEELGDVFAQTQREKTLDAPPLVPVGATTAMVSIPRFAAIFRGSTEVGVLESLSDLGVGVYTAPNGIGYFSLWVFELCLLIKTLNVSPMEAAKLLKVGQTVYKAAESRGAERRLLALAKKLSPTTATS